MAEPRLSGDHSASSQSIPPVSPRARRRWLHLGGRALRLWFRQPARTADLVAASYDRISPGYDHAWTHHMRDLALEMLTRLAPPPGGVGVDLTCGTGFVTRELAARLGGDVTGVDASAGMLECAREHAASSDGPRPTFVQADAVAFLRNLAPGSVDVITCAWGLGYTRPWRLLWAARRALRPGGRIGIIDNSLFSLAEVLWASALVFAERPSALSHVMRVRFLPGPRTLAALMRSAGFAVERRWGGERTYHVADGSAAIARLQATGAAAGFEFAATPEQREAVFARFAEVMEQRYGVDAGVPITHRFLAAVGRRR